MCVEADRSLDSIRDDERLESWVDVECVAWWAVVSVSEPLEAMRLVYAGPVEDFAAVRR